MPKSRTAPGEDTPARAPRSLAGPLVLFLVALLPRLLFVLLHRHPELIVEMKGYDEAARCLLAGQPYIDRGRYLAFIPPGYVGYLALVYAAFGHSIAAARLLHAVLDALTALLTWRLGAGLFGERAGRLAGWIYALYPLAWVYGDFLYTETLYTTLTIAALLLLGIALQAGPAALAGGPAAQGAFLGHPKRPWLLAAAASGLLFGLAALTRSVILYFPLFLLLLGLWRFRAERRHLWPLILAALVTLLVVAPWTIRNYRVTGGFIPVNSKAGLDIFLYNHGSLSQILDKESDQAEEAAFMAQAKTDLELYRGGTARAKAWALAHPGTFLFKGVRFQWLFFGLEREAVRHQMYGYFGRVPRWLSALTLPVTVLPGLLLLPLAFLGLCAAPRGNRAVFIHRALFGYFILLVFISYGFDRLRFPLTPLLAVYGAWALLARRELLPAGGLRAWLRKRPVALALGFTTFCAVGWLIEAATDAGPFLRLIGL